MRNTFILFLIFGLLNVCYSQAEPFSEIDFSTGDYVLAGLLWHESEPNELMKELGNWYIDDVEVLNSIKEEWVFNEPGKMYACGYHYLICLLKDGQKIKEFLVNLDCKEASLEGSYYVFKPSLITSIKSNFKKLKKSELGFNGLEEARKRYKDLSSDPTVIIVDQPSWLKHEGSFKFNYLCGDDISDCGEMEHKIMVNIKSQLNKNYPNETFQLYSYGFSSDDIYFKIDCDKSLFEQFQMQSIKKENWEPFNLKLKLYRK